MGFGGALGFRGFKGLGFRFLRGLKALSFKVYSLG